MTSKSARGIAIGFLFAGVIVLAASWVIEDEPETASSEETPEVENTPLVRESGLDYYDDDALLEEIEERGLVSEDEEQTSETTDTLYMTISSGMSSGEVAELLERAEMIEDADEFQTMIHDANLEMLIQTGFYEIESTLSPEEIIRVITREADL
ncbi:hypothetical protein JCM19037_1712 [Geomicrobium sp. JCM 19037]|uniref:hypothetical protein n=1 Tax=unclassified Geomicrobium TaxID=2628951 RepID=UPI00045F29C3|nr:hypothetical protein [Geomicrobium sp. JCM 19037]GAK03389.1 hypothetical protein JCM19037_1712 [Geomicrobium sp. JCM 19037]